ncbi:SAM-dependent methyltransferase [Kribbella amoyensis]|uniref:SAM-dependent methyltransferase n=1 Tax=Kribbella amoyensis TaxID=996641 RepID=UPI0011A38388|nr:methyltransferase domain-containing protein [Kribbella amoyensis]
MDDDELDGLLKNERYPRSGRYSGRWMVDGVMGPNAVWQAEALGEVIPLEAGMRVLDLGCGTALSSIFLAKEFGVEVWATDLWVKPDENWGRIVDAGVEGQVHPVSAEAHELPFADGFFDAAISIGAYHYFGTDDLYLGYFSRFLKPGGWIGIVQPGLAEECPSYPPAGLEEYWHWDFCAWHSPDWWRRHWEKTGLVTVDLADRLAEGWRDWLHWNEVCDRDSEAPQWEADMLRTDAGRLLGFTRVVARRNPE